MGRYRAYNPKQGFFSIVDPEKIKASSPLLSIVDWFVEKHVEEEVFSRKLENQDSGAQAVHPKIMLKIILYGFSTGVRSYRGLEDHLQWDPYFWVLSCQQRIDHSTICKFMQKYSLEIEHHLVKLYYILDQMGIVGCQTIAIDGTKIEANVSLRRFVGTAADYEKKSAELKEKIEQIRKENDGEEHTERLRKLEQSKEKIDAFLYELEHSPVESKETDRIHPVDPDARFVKDQDSIIMGYNGQIAVDADSHLIVASDITNESSDARQLQPMIQQLNTQFGEERIMDSNIVADAGFSSSENITYCEANNLDAYIPEGAGADGGKQSSSQTITSKDCQLEDLGSTKVLTCPGGQRMEATTAKNCGKGKFFYIFTPDHNSCSNCPFRERCLDKRKSAKTFKVKREYMDSLHARQRMRQKLATDEGKKIYRLRGSTVEHVFGTIKEVLMLRRFLHRRLKKVRLIWRMICAAYNFRRLSVLGFSALVAEN